MIQSVLTVEEERCQNKCYAASMILLVPLIKRNISEHRKNYFCCLGHTGHCRWYLYHKGNQKNVREAVKNVLADFVRQGGRGAQRV